jgi:hypothetical protein
MAMIKMVSALALASYDQSAKFWRRMCKTAWSWADKLTEICNPHLIFRTCTQKLLHCYFWELASTEFPSRLGPKGPTASSQEFAQHQGLPEHSICAETNRAVHSFSV